ncbi:MAG: peptidylprolyl isomerase [Methanomethylovorans sp.]|nr:peptidylprolyl isomerase [Methanomethylovorans sp.]
MVSLGAKLGDIVAVEYIGTLDNGGVFDSSEMQGGPLEFQVGGGQVLQGFEDAVLGMEIGDKKTIRLEPSEGYGEYSKNLIETIPRTSIPNHERLKEDTMLLVSLPDGSKMPASITAITEETVTLDMNHPLAGEVLHFEIKVVGIN